MKRMSRAHRRNRLPGFNLTALMDIFTILVFFLLVNSSTAEQLPAQKNLVLPESTAETKPEQTVVVMITRDRVLVQGRPVAALADVLDSSQRTVPAVVARLQDVRKHVIGINTKVVARKNEVTIMGDRKTPFRLLRKLMQSCTRAGYTTISLAVIQKAPKKAES